MSPLATALPDTEGGTTDDFGLDELDVEVEVVGGAVEHIIKMTEDGCNSTCASACTSC